MKFNKNVVVSTVVLFSISLFNAHAVAQGSLVKSSSAKSAARPMQANTDQPPALIDPNIERREINESDIDTEDLEIGIFGGFIVIEDFESSAVVGVSLAYHINENLFLEARYAQATAGQTSFEKLSGGAPFLTEEERDYTYYNLSIGYNINGETFFTDNLVFNSDIYFTLGAGSTEFGGDERFTISAGAGYRLLFTDFWALKVDVRDHVFTSDIIGVEKDVHNIAITLSTTFFF
ncbi:MAG: outer membrane beta-barrel protein [Bermanella sp.]|jgi:outer membrane beta-barrel protein|uniref:outer membrane beta-barrel domain-containing protein n=1 Tax=Glaciecola sp. 33A TaxID=2057807 RepID=UPI000C32570A|nr:outer membrane beta-barrel domain-containing protein [Glaciecola sp. 33A]PKI01213.1 outer membrane beta-barrel domain-containing protein [Glaciecola sp. 33A]